MKRPYIKWPVVWSILVGFGTVVFIATAGLLCVNWVQSKIDSAVERKLSDPFILRQIAAQSRPMKPAAVLRCGGV
jgi:hypothetical protein